MTLQLKQTSCIMLVRPVLKNKKLGEGEIFPLFYFNDEMLFLTCEATDFIGKIKTPFLFIVLFVCLTTF